MDFLECVMQHLYTNVSMYDGFTTGNNHKKVKQCLPSAERAVCVAEMSHSFAHFHSVHNFFGIEVGVPTCLNSNADHDV